MAFVDLKNHYGVNNEVAPINGRPDFGNWEFGKTEAKKFPPYVFSINGNALLMHRIARVEVDWWKIGGPRGARLIRTKRPRLVATTICGQTKFLDGDRTRTCKIPDPGSILCGRCHGEPATFGKHGRAKREGITREQANVRLNCIVKGY